MRRPWFLLLAALAAASGCDNAPVAVRAPDLQQQRAAWASHNLTRYAYVYETTGFLSAWSGRPVRLVVINGAVSSAQYVSNDSLLPDPSVFPTLDGLFDQAEAALAAGTLTAITFDSTFGFPTRMDLAGPPDASGSIVASGFELLP